MKRTTIMAEPELLATIKKLADQRGVPFSELVREALEEKAREYRPKPGSLGVGQSPSDAPPVDWSRRVPGNTWR